MKKNRKRGPKTIRPVTKPVLKKAIDIVGGVSNLAIEIGLNESNVSEWLYTDKQVPCHHVPKIVEATDGKIKPEDLRPDVYTINGLKWVRHKKK